MPVPDLPTTVVVGKYVDTATGIYFSAVFWCQQSFSTVSTEIYVPSVYPERSVLASINLNIQTWIQTDEMQKNPGSIIKRLDLHPHLNA